MDHLIVPEEPEAAPASVEAPAAAGFHVRPQSVSVARREPKRMPGVFECPHCGSDVPANATVCGACANTVQDPFGDDADPLSVVTERRRTTVQFNIAEDAGARDRGRSRVASTVDRTRMRTVTREAPPPVPAVAAPAPALAKGKSVHQLEAEAAGALAAGKAPPTASPTQSADSCVYCGKVIPLGTPFCPLAPEVERELTGPKVHHECWDPFFDDVETSRCEWCCLPCTVGAGLRKNWHDGSQAAGRAPIAGVPHGGAAGALGGTGKRVLHQACIEPYNKTRGTKCGHCGQAVTVGKRVERYGLVHNGWCFDQLMKRAKKEEQERLKRVEAEDFTCAQCKQLILPDEEYYPLDAEGKVADDEGGGDGGGEGGGGGGGRKIHVGCWEASTHNCLHCAGEIGYDTEFYEVPASMLAPKKARGGDGAAADGAAADADEDADADGPPAGVVHIDCWEAFMKTTAPRCAQCGEAVEGEHCVESSTYEGHVAEYILHVACFEPWKLMERQKIAELDEAAEEEAKRRTRLSAVADDAGEAAGDASPSDDEDEDEGGEDPAAASTANESWRSEAPAAAGVAPPPPTPQSSSSFAHTSMVEQAAAAAATIAAAQASIDVSDAADKKVEVVLGWMWKRGQRIRSWKRRWAVVRGCALWYYASDTPGAKEKGSVRLWGGVRARLIEIRTTPHGAACGFELVEGTRTFIAYPEAKVHADGSVTVGAAVGGGKVVAPSHFEATPWVRKINDAAEVQQGD